MLGIFLCYVMLQMILRDDTLTDRKKQGKQKPQSEPAAEEVVICPKKAV